MEATVKRLREQGRRRPMDAINAEPGTRGTISLAPRSGAPELHLLAATGGAPHILRDARLVQLHRDVMLFSGIESGPDGIEHVQEWSARVRLASWQGELFAAEPGPEPSGTR